MTRLIQLPEKLTAATINDLMAALTAADGADAVDIDGRGVRVIAAQPAECLTRFVIQARKRDVQVQISASQDMIDDLETLGLDGLILPRGADT